MNKINIFERAKSQLIKGNYEFARKLFKECMDENNKNIYVIIEICILDIICGNESIAKKNMNYCMNSAKYRTIEYLKELDNFGKKNSNSQTNSEFLIYMSGLEKLQEIVA